MYTSLDFKKSTQSAKKRLKDALEHIMLSLQYLH